LSQPTISSHLKKLENNSLITYSKDGKWINYNLNPGLNNNLKKLITDIILILKNDHQLERDRVRLNSINRENICKRY